MEKTGLEQATLGGGCFWCLEAVFLELKGVLRVQSGYAGGRVPQPTYEQVCTGQTGHAEVVQVDFDPAELSYADLLKVFFAIHDPTTLNRQGADVGTQYRSVKPRPGTSSRSSRPRASSRRRSSPTSSRWTSSTRPRSTTRNSSPAIPTSRTAWPWWLPRSRSFASSSSIA